MDKERGRQREREKEGGAGEEPQQQLPLQERNGKVGILSVKKNINSLRLQYFKKPKVV